MAVLQLKSNALKTDNPAIYTEILAVCPFHIRLLNFSCLSSFWCWSFQFHYSMHFIIELMRKIHTFYLLLGLKKLSKPTPFHLTVRIFCIPSKSGVNWNWSQGELWNQLAKEKRKTSWKYSDAVQATQVLLEWFIILHIRQYSSSHCQSLFMLMFYY